MPEADDIDLGDEGSLALLRRIDLRWADLGAEGRVEALARLRMTVPPLPPQDPGLAVLPGGALALRTADGPLVPDPAEACLFGLRDLRRLGALTCRHASMMVVHDPAGLRAVPGWAGGALPPQAAMIVAAGGLEELTGWAEPALLAWGRGGAVCWPLLEAPPVLALVASLAGVALAPGEALPLAAWAEEDPFQVSSLAIAERVEELLALEVSDALRYALVEACADGMAARAAAALAALPSCFRRDPLAWPGEPPPEHAASLARLRRFARPRVMLGLARTGLPRLAVAALRRVLEGVPARLVVEALPAAPAVALGSDAALFAARQAGPDGRLGVLFDPPEDAAALYGLGRDVVRAAGLPVVLAAPCWGFAHRLAADGVGEGGNAAWFGMGVGLEELAWEE